MFLDVVDLRDFYATTLGQVAVRIAAYTYAQTTAGLLSALASLPTPRARNPSAP